MKILILLAILYLVNARHTRNRRRDNYHNDRDNINRKEMSKIIELLQDISNNLRRPPPQIVYVPYPIVLNGKDTPDVTISSMKEDAAHNDGTPKTEALHKINNPDPNNILPRLSVEDSNMTWGLIAEEKEDKTPQEEITEANSKNYNFLFDSDRNDNKNWGRYSDEEDLDDTVASKTSRAVNPEEAFKNEILNNSTITWGLIKKKKEDKTPQEQILEAHSKNDNFLKNKTDKNWGRLPDEEDSASPTSEESVASEISLEERFNIVSDEMDLNHDVGRPLNFDSFKTLELLPTAPPVEHGSNQAGLSLNFEEALRIVDVEESKEEMVTTKKHRNECTLAILACCKENESKMEGCFKIFKCSKIYSPGITCLKDVTNIAFKIFEEHIVPKLIEFKNSSST